MADRMIEIKSYIKNNGTRSESIVFEKSVTSAELEILRKELKIKHNADIFFVYLEK